MTKTEKHNMGLKFVTTYGFCKTAFITLGFTFGHFIFVSWQEKLELSVEGEKCHLRLIWIDSIPVWSTETVDLRTALPSAYWTTSLFGSGNSYF